jgi:hypothetical protein
MINYVKYLLAIILLFVSSSSQAQVKTGRFIGVNFSDMSMKVKGNAINTDNSIGIHFGGILDMPVAGNFSFRPAVLFSGKGSTYNNDTLDVFLSPVYIEVPLLAAYTFGSRSLKLTIFAGPYFAFGFGGNKIENGGNTHSISYGSDTEDDIKHLDAGINMGGGISYKDLMISVQYGLGMANISSGSIPESEIKNNVIGISITSFFADKK